MKPQFGVEVSWKKDEIDALTPAPQRRAVGAGQAAYEKKETQVGSDMMRYLERMLMLQVVDAQWKDHLLAMDHLKEGIGLRGYGQKDPLIEYKREGFEMFEAMELRIARDTVSFLMKVQVAVEAERAAPPATCRRCRWRCRAAAAAGASSPPRLPEACRPWRPPGQGRPERSLPCGSGKKYKKCCGPEPAGN